jgi:hypothetical protein
MRARTLDRFATRPTAWLGFATGVAGIVVVTLVIELLQSFVPVLTLGVLYVFAVRRTTMSIVRAGRHSARRLPTR